MEVELELTPEDEAFRAELRAFLDVNLPKDWGRGSKPWKGAGERLEFLRDWQRRLNKERLVAVAWPEEFGGRGASVMQQIIYSEEMSKRSTPEILNRGALLQLGPAIIQWGSKMQKEYFLPRMLNADDMWCQGFSEPGGGSDLAAMTTKAVDNGDHYLISGSKIWTSRAEIADWCFLLARTDPKVKKHQGISAFLLKMGHPGITIRPLKQISGITGFNQVFFDDVPVPKEYLLGELNAGWKVATNTLRYERAGTATSRAERRFEVLTRLMRETVVDGKRRIDDPVVRDKMVRYSAVVEALKEIGWRQIVGGLRGTPPGPESSIGKLLWSETDQSMADFGMEMLGPYGPLQPGSERAVKGGNPSQSYLIMRAATIGGGTSEIQRNVIGERVLGLPRD